MKTPEKRLGVLTTFCLQKYVKLLLGVMSEHLENQIYEMKMSLIVGRELELNGLEEGDELPVHIMKDSSHNENLK